jgi:hypothetical protein
MGRMPKKLKTEDTCFNHSESAYVLEVEPVPCCGDNVVSGIQHYERV